MSSDGTFSAATSQVANTAVGKGGSINIQTGSLSVTNGAQLLASTFGKGDGGNLTVNAFDSVQLTGTSANDFPNLLSTGTEGAGNAGDLTITTRTLQVQDEAQVSMTIAERAVFLSIRLPPLPPLLKNSLLRSPIKLLLAVQPLEKINSSSLDGVAYHPAPPNPLAVTQFG